MFCLIKDQRNSSPPGLDESQGHWDFSRTTGHQVWIPLLEAVQMMQSRTHRPYQQASEETWLYLKLGNKTKQYNQFQLVWGTIRIISQEISAFVMGRVVAETVCTLKESESYRSLNSKEKCIYYKPKQMKMVFLFYLVLSQHLQVCPLM